ncbi:heparinase II/III domain-containing protein [Cellulomonas aerilata]|uniref:heparinase II/III domain-containing protein n=1 Tax=Cellulomonas aerilata TaxID=515326 RepID=UPI0031E21746
MPTQPGPDDAGSPHPRARPPVFCVAERAHRPRQSADDALEGRYTSDGRTLEIGLDPDWRGDGPTQDVKWRLGWSTFTVGLDLAAALSETGDRRYLAAWERLVASWTDQVEVGTDPGEVTGRRLQNWVYAWQAFAAAGAPPSESTVELLMWSMGDQLAQLVGDLAVAPGHRTPELYAVLVVALALPALDPGGRLAGEAWAALHRDLLDAVGPDGVHRAHSPHAHLVALRAFVGARENARRFGLTVPAGYDERLALACRFGMHLTRPDGAVPALSGPGTGDLADVLALASTLVDVPGMAWAATRGAVGRPPTERGPDFPQGGLSVQRSGWGHGPGDFADERFLVLAAGRPADGGTGRGDALGMEAYGRGRPLVVDSGWHGGPEALPPGEHRSTTTGAHNTVVVDGADPSPDQPGTSAAAPPAAAPSAAAPPAAAPSATPGPPARRRSDGVDLLTVEVTSPADDVRHTRQVAFVAGEYWVVVDTLTAPTGSSHEYAQRFHLPAGAWHATTVHPRAEDVLVTAPGVALLYPAGSAPTLAPGWVAGGSGAREHVPVAVVTSHSVPRACLVTVLWPLPDDAPPPPHLHLEDGGRDGGDVLRVRLTGAGPSGTATDELTLPVVGPDGRGAGDGDGDDRDARDARDDGAAAGPVRGDGPLAWRRAGA